jgi:hypothetical protein
LASAQTFGFATVAGNPFCNYVQFTQLKPYAVWQGVDNLSACGLNHNATLVGISGHLSQTGNPAGFAVKGVTFADNIYDAFSYSYTGAQWEVTMNLKCSTKVYGWVGFAGVSGIVFGENDGWLTCTIPGKDAVATKGPTIGNVKLPKRK